MSERTVGTEPADDGTLVVVARSVGLVRDLPEVGDVVAPGRLVGRVETLGRLEALRAPQGLFGKVVERLVPGASRVPVGYDTPLFRVDSRVIGAPLTETESAFTTNELVFRAPMSGRFYTRAAPGKPPMIEVSGIVETGQAIGLLEVMKTFHRIVYGGEGLPERARVLRVVPSDGDDVTRGAVLVEIEPL